MRSQIVWEEYFVSPTQPPPENSQITNTIWAIAFKPDGSEFIMALGDRVVIYETQSGEMISSLCAHENTVYAVAYSKDGKKFASGGADCGVIVWNSKAQPVIKYHHTTSVQCLDFNPVSHVLASGSGTDYGLWSQDKNAVEKPTVVSKILCLAWSPDGSVLALGCYNGQILLKEKGVTQLASIQKDASVWCLAWNPVKEENQDSHFVAACWDQTFNFYDQSGKQLTEHAKKLNCDPCSISYFSNGQFFIVAGSDKKATLYTKQGVYIGVVAERDAWLWTAQVRPKQNSVVIGGLEGKVALYQMSFNVVHGLYQDRYAYRDLMTDVAIQHLVTEQKVRIKCRDLVKKIAVYKDKVAFQLPESILIYSAESDDEYDMKYKRIHKIAMKLECTLLVLTSFHLISCQDRKLELYNFNGELEREWILDGIIRYIKVNGGPPGREGILLGLKSGNVLKIFIDNPFPVTLLRQHLPIRCLDISNDRKQVALVDDNFNMYVYNLANQQIVFQDTQVNSVSWNSDMTNLLAYSGNGALSIKTGPFPPITQKMLGFVVGFRGSKIFSLHYITMNTIDVPQTAAMYKYVEQKNYQMAYQVACLGVTEQDWRSFAIECITAHKFDFARQAFIRIKDIRFLELLTRIEVDRKNPNYNDSIMLGDIAAYQGKYTEAANLYDRGNDVMRAVNMFKELKQWEKAQEWVKKLDKEGQLKLLQEQAEDTEENDWQVSAKLFINVGEYKKAVAIIGKNRDYNWLIDICRNLSKADNYEAIQTCADIFRQAGHHAFAKEALLKLGDIKSLLNLHIELKKWDEAFRLAKQNPELQNQLYLPYAEWLINADKFEEALEAYKKCNRHDIALRLLERLTKNSVNEQRYIEAGLYYQKLAIEHLRLIQDCMNPTEECANHFIKYEDFQKFSEVYYAYSFVHKYIEEPFLTLMPGVNYEELVFNSCRFVINTILSQSSAGINKIYLYYAFGKLAQKMEAYHSARTAFEKLQTLKVPDQWQEEIDLTSLTIRAKPYIDREDLLSICNRCMSSNSLLNLHGTGDICTSCRHPIIRSFVSFTPLPLVEFEPVDTISQARVMQLIRSEGSGKRQKTRRQANDGWRENRGADHQSLNFEQYQQDQDDYFVQKVTEWAELQMTQDEYRPVLVDEITLSSLSPEEVFIVDHTEVCPTLPRKYYKLMIPDIDITLCDQCGHFFLRDEYDFAYLEHGGCPVCHSKEPNTEDS